MFLHMNRVSWKFGLYFIMDLKLISTAATTTTRSFYLILLILVTIKLATRIKFHR